MAIMPMRQPSDQQESMFEDSFADPDPSADSADTSYEAIQENSFNHPLKSNLEPLPMTVLTVDDFAALEERILRAVDLVRRERQGRAAAEERIAALEVELQQLRGQTSTIEHLQQEVESLRVEREQVRLRVERLLGQLDALEL
jgi:hypothetical protein